MLVLFFPLSFFPLPRQAENKCPLSEPHIWRLSILFRLPIDKPASAACIFLKHQTTIFTVSTPQGACPPPPLLEDQNAMGTLVSILLSPEVEFRSRSSVTFRSASKKGEFARPRELSRI
ncbi:hypothetical protein QR685DRAFT_524578, partial [Neurospora intermedia]